MLTELTNAYEAAIQEQALLRNKIVTPFDRQVAESIFTAGLLAIEDRARDVSQYRVVSAPTGSGKSSFAQAFIKAFVEVYPEGSALFLVETIQQAEDTYQGMSSLLGREKVAVWTSAHDLHTSPETIRHQHGFLPDQRFTVDQLATYPVAIVTHNFYKKSRSAKATVYRGKARKITFIDERIEDVSIYDVDTGLIKVVRDRIAERHSSTLEHVHQLTQLHDHLEALWQSASGRSAFDEIPEGKKINLDWFRSEQASNYIASSDDQVRNVFGFGRALANGFAFLARYDVHGKGARFVGYEMNMPLRPGMILLDATADIDGVSLLVTNRLHVRVPRVDFSNLTITHIEPELPKGLRLSEVLSQAKTAKPYADWIKRTIIENSLPQEKVLAVVHRGLLNHEYLPSDHREFAHAFDLCERQVCFIHWGSGIGSNRWKDATTVFLFGEFHIPKRALVGTSLGLLEQQATADALTPFQSPNPKGKAISLVREGHLCRWMKQLAMRGNARNIDAQGNCGEQRLYVTGEFDRIIQYKEQVFPGARLTATHKPNQGRHRGVMALVFLLYTTDATQITAPEVQQLTGASFQKNKGRYLSDAVVMAAMRDTGFIFVAGGGRGKQGRFVRALPRLIDDE